MTPEIAEVYGNKVRIRVCGICWQNDRLLMVKHQMGNQVLWAPPGGGLEFGESMAETLKREMREETGLNVVPGRFLFGCEFIQPPLHAVECFFEVGLEGGNLMNGNDPELPMISSVSFLTVKEIAAIPGTSRHGIFNMVASAADLRKLTGFYRI